MTGRGEVTEGNTTSSEPTMPHFFIDYRGNMAILEAVAYASLSSTSIPNIPGHSPIIPHWRQRQKDISKKYTKRSKLGF